MFEEFVSWLTEDPADKAKRMTDQQLADAIRSNSMWCAVYRDEMHIRLLERSQRGRYIASSEAAK